MTWLDVSSDWVARRFATSDTSAAFSPKQTKLLEKTLQECFNKFGEEVGKHIDESLAGIRNDIMDDVKPQLLAYRDVHDPVDQDVIATNVLEATHPKRATKQLRKRNRDKCVYHKNTLLQLRPSCALSSVVDSQSKHRPVHHTDIEVAVHGIVSDNAATFLEAASCTKPSKTASRRARRKRIDKCNRIMRDELLSYRLPKMVQRPRALCLNDLLPITIVDGVDDNSQNDSSASRSLMPSALEPSSQDGLNDLDRGGMSALLARVLDLEDKLAPMQSAMQSVASITMETQKYVAESAKNAQSDRQEVTERLCELLNQLKNSFDEKVDGIWLHLRSIEEDDEDVSKDDVDCWELLLDSLDHPDFSCCFENLLTSRM